MKSWDKRFCSISWRTLGQPRWWIVWSGISLGSLWFAKIYNLPNAGLVQWLKEHINQLREFGLSILFIHSSPKKSRVLFLHPISISGSHRKFWGLEMLRCDLLLFFRLSFLVFFPSVKSITKIAHKGSGNTLKAWKGTRQKTVISGVIFCTWGFCWVVINHPYSLCPLKSVKPLSWGIV